MIKFLDSGKSCAFVELDLVEMVPTLEDVVGKARLQLDSAQQSTRLNGLCEFFWRGDHGKSVGVKSILPVTPCDGQTMHEEEALVELNSNMNLNQKMS